MSMTVLEATVEIVKALVQPGGTGAGAQCHYLTSEESRGKFLQGMQEIYKTLDKLTED